MILANERHLHFELRPEVQISNTVASAYFDIGETGARADAVSIWIAHFVGQKINVLDYYEAQGQPLAVHLDRMRLRGWGDTWVILPHDGAHGKKFFATSYESAIREAGFDVLVIPNQGAGAASARIERRGGTSPEFSSNAETTEAGRDAIGWYHEKKSNDDRNMGLGPTTIGARMARTASG